MAYHGLVEVWSGGQIGADIAGLRAARGLDVKTGGWIPRGFRTHNGPRIEYGVEYGLVETETSGYPTRTKANARDTDGTFILGDNQDSSGCALTRFACETNGKPYLAVTIREMDDSESAANAARWLQTHGIRRLNIAGNRDAPEEIVEAWLRQVFRRVQSNRDEN